MEERAGQHQSQGQHDGDGTIACYRYEGIVGQQGIAAVSLAGVAIAIDDALLIGLGRAEAAALERPLASASVVANVALVTELIGWTDLAVRMILDGAARIDRITGALQALGAILWENQTVAALIR